MRSLRVMALALFGVLGVTTSAGATEATTSGIGAPPEGMISVAEEFVANTDFRRDLGLERADLDYSVESLKHIDAALQRLHEELPDGQDGKDLSTVADEVQFVTFSLGSYLGEVIRRKTGAGAKWDGYSALTEREKELFGPEENLGNAFYIRTPPGQMTFPLSKVLKFLMNGSVDSTYFYAKVVLKDEIKN